MAQLMAWGEWRPDVSSLEGSHSPTVINAIPRGDGYGPMQGYTALSAAHASACQGFFSAFGMDGSLSLFSSTARRLYKLNNATFAWTDVSLGAPSDYAALATGSHWQFAQWYNQVIAVNVNVVPQNYVLGSSTQFANLGGSPPQAACITTVGAFVLLGGLNGDNWSVQWSSRNNPGEWTIGLNEGDKQTFRDGGIVRGIVGGEYGLVFQDRAIRRMTYSPGSATVMEFDVLSRELGLYAPYSLVRVRDMVFFLSDVGFHMWHPLAGFKAIGKERIDRTFFDDHDQTQKHMVIGAFDPQSSRIVWAYKSTTSGITDQFDRMIVYDWQLDRWAGWINMAGEWLGLSATPGQTLEGLNSLGSMDAQTVPFDSYPAQAANTLAMANALHAIGLLNGANLEVILETAEIDIGTRSFINGQRPLTDCAQVLGSVAGKPIPETDLTYSTERGITRIGSIPCRVDNRIVRFKNRFPANSEWQYSIGTEPDIRPSGAQ